MCDDDDNDRLHPGRPSEFGVFAPSVVYLAGEDKIRITAFSNTANVTLAIVGRILRPDSTPTPIAESLLVNSNRTATTKTCQVSEGWLLGLGIGPAAGVVTLGATWVMVDLIRGDGNAAQFVQSLGFGFITARNNYAWPGGINTLSTDGPGVLRSITGSTPGAGAEISEACPAGARWELLAFSAALTSSSTVANRIPQLLFDDGANVYYRVPTNAAQAASLTDTWGWAQGASFNPSPVQTSQVAPTPTNLRIGAGHRIRTSTGGIQAADQWTAPQYLVREWLEGA